jgi:hypothetical protein
MGSGAMTYIPSFIKTCSGIRKLIGGDSQTHRQHKDLISLCFFENKENRPKIKANLFLTPKQAVLGTTKK